MLGIENVIGSFPRHSYLLLVDWFCWWSELKSMMLFQYRGKKLRSGLVKLLMSVSVTRHLTDKYVLEGAVNYTPSYWLLVHRAWPPHQSPSQLPPTHVVYEICINKAVTAKDTLTQALYPFGWQCLAACFRNLKKVTSVALKLHLGFFFKNGRTVYMLV